MPRIYKSQGPSVALRESQRSGDPGFIQAPNSFAQIEESGRQSQRYLASAQDQFNRNTQFQQTALARAQRAQEGNAQLALSQTLKNQEIAWKNDEFQGRAALNNLQLAQQQTSQASQIALAQQGVQNQQLTDLGNSFIKFSETLWQKKAEQINKENEELKVTLLNSYLSNPERFEPDVANVERAEILRTQGLLNAETSALWLESQGLKGAAAQVRAGNPFALRGIEEGRAIKSSLGYQTYLTGKYRDAIDSGELNKLSPDYRAKLTQLFSIASNEYLKEQGLIGVNPGVLAKYFGYTKAQVEAQLLQDFTNEGYKETKAAQKAVAEAQVYNSAAAISAMPREQWTAELQRLAAASTAANGMNPIEGHKSMLQQLIKAADQSNDFSLVDAFVQSDRGDGQPYGATPGIQEVYDKARGLFVTKQAAQLEKLQGDQLEGIEADFNRVFTTGDVTAIREAQDTAVSRLMQLGTPEAMAKARSIASTNPGESPMIQEQLRRAEDGGYLDRFLRENRDRMTNSTFERYAKRAEQTSKLKEPAYQQALNQVLIRMKVAAGEANEIQRGTLPPHERQALNDYTKLQQDKLTQYAREWLAQNPGSNVKDFEDWLKRQEKDYTDPKQFVVDPKSAMPRGMQSLGGGTEFTGNPMVRRVTFGGRMREDYRAPQVQAGLANGSISGKAIQFNTDIVFTQNQVSDAVTNYEKNGTWPQLMVDIASRTGHSVKSMVQAQARVYGGRGVITDPGKFQLPPSPSGSGKVSFDAVQNFGKASGLSQRGAIAFATMVQDESGGDPIVPGDGGDAMGLMQWNRAASPDRVRRLQQFAAQRGKPVTDPGVQLNYAIYEMKNFYPSVWSVLSSRNPTNNQLWRATVEYLGFNPRVYGQRRSSLEANLR
jgi:hypothetical protein